MFVDLVNKQLEPHGVTYTDVRGDANWFIKYKTTVQQQNKFIDWAIYYLIDKTEMSTKRAESEVSLFVLQYGLMLKNKNPNLV